MGKDYILNPEQIKMIEKAAKNSDRIELIPHKDGIFKITAIQRKELKIE